jgi:hypothetical protein
VLRYFAELPYAEIAALLGEHARRRSAVVPR